ncbi:alpha-glucosidase [Bifidobacterium sp. BRDM6]|uniref:Alpha-glucosidase n=2 Tax=Bifidobacterium choloepi TaxID=2614131 RepID=A0A6I5NC57_9BIFI|nr:alpha-glucosidase [Bifidobacterium choloepi]
MRDDAVVQGDHWRIGLITDSLVRFEWSDSGEFEDLPTQTALVRDFGETPDYTVRRDEHGNVVIDTGQLTIVYDGKPFSREGLSVTINGLDFWANTWTYGDSSEGHGPGGNLKGTARTLDEVDGRCELEDGVISHEGWAILDDSSSNVLVPTGESSPLDDSPAATQSTDESSSNAHRNPFGQWTAPRASRERDFYFFGYGHRYADAVADFQRLTGGTPLLPRFALGNWWSRYYPYRQDEYLALMDRFKAEGIPFTTAVLDMDWHVTNVDRKYGSSWTGYSWNRELLPEPGRLLDGLHARGLKTTVNDHPRDGIRAFEDHYDEAARRMGRDDMSIMAGEPLAFDVADPAFMDASLAVHHALEDDGVDFWWLDWQQGGTSRQPGLDPLWMLNHLHYLDSGRHETVTDPETGETTTRRRWPLTFSRYAGPGSQRYSIGFSGDSIMSWKSLAFQPEFTATASNIGYGWWSHDIGGHMLGERDDELEARWYQLGAFSPINRLHSSCSPFSGKEPWNFGPAARQAMTGALRLRHALIPYLYSMNYRAAEQSMPLVEPMYWSAPDVRAAYDVPDEYWFGTELVVAPVTRPNGAASLRGRADVWLPAGQWFDFFDGRRYDASGSSAPAGGSDGAPSFFAGASDGRSMAVWRGLDRIPVFAKAGAIVPMQPVAESGPDVNAIANPERLSVVVFPGADGRFVLREDDGEYGSPSADTAMTFHWNDGEVAEFAVDAVRSADPAAIAAVPAGRRWSVTFRGVAPVVAEEVTVLVDGQSDAVVSTPSASDSAPSSDSTPSGAVPFSVRYDEPTMSLTVELADAVPSASAFSIRFAPGTLRFADNPVVADVEDLLLHAQMPNMTKEQVFQMVREQGPRAIAAFATLEAGAGVDENMRGTWLPEDVAGAVSEIVLRS